MSQPICPKCSAKLKDDYGMVPCPSCGSFVFVDMDGIAHISRDEGPAVVDAVEPAVEAPPALEAADGDAANFDVFPPQAFSSETTNGLEAPPIVDLPPLETNEDVPLPEEPSPFETPIAEPVAEVALDPYQAPVAEEPGGELDMDRLLGFNEPAPQDPVAESGPVEFGSPGDPLGINEYANSELSQAKDGLLTFKILISGIDSKEMRESLRSALDDQRFGWNASDLMSRISKGVLQIDNVASVKAVILINRIKRMPVKVRWEQYAITNMDEA